MFILIYICIKLNMSSYYPQLLILYIVDPSDFHGLSVNSHSNSKKKKKKQQKKKPKTLVLSSAIHLSNYSVILVYMYRLPRWLTQW